MRFLKLKEVMEKTALSRSAIYRKMDEGSFPQTVSLGDRALAWIDSEVEEWMEKFYKTECEIAGCLALIRALIKNSPLTQVLASGCRGIEKTGTIKGYSFAVEHLPDGYAMDLVLNEREC